MTTAATATRGTAATAADPRPHGPLRGWCWCTLLAAVVARAAVAFFGTLVVAALVPVVTRWDGYVVTSGSMEPHIAVGDVVLAQPMTPDKEVVAERVFVFEDQADPTSRRLVVHRVVERRPGGRWTTAGDANADVDVEPVPRSAFVARAVVLVPLVGQPVIWWREGRYGPLLAGAVLAAAALAVALTVRLPRAGGPAGGGSGRAGSGHGPGAEPGRRHLPWSRRRRAAALARSAVALPIVALAVTLVTAPALGTASSAFTATARSAGNSWTFDTPWLQPYNKAVLTDGPYAYYHLDEANGPALVDSSGNGRNGTAAAVTAYRQPGALPNNPGYSVNLAGSGRIVSGGSASSNPTTFTLELWFRTTSSAAGKLIGFESGTGTSSASFDRHVTLDNGRLVFGDWVTTPYRTLTSPRAYNDGAWHHLVLTAVPRSGSQLDAVMYVDGAVVASGAVSRVAAYTGWWRVGQGRAGTLGQATGFPGRVDQVAIYRTTLSPARVQAHYAAR